MGSREKLTFHHSELTRKCRDEEKKECLMEQINFPLTGLLNVPRVLMGASRGSSDFLPQARELIKRIHSFWQSPVEDWGSNFPILSNNGETNLFIH